MRGRAGTNHPVLHSTSSLTCNRRATLSSVRHGRGAQTRAIDSRNDRPVRGKPVPVTPCRPSLRPAPRRLWSPLIGGVASSAPRRLARTRFPPRPGQLYSAPPDRSITIGQLRYLRRTRARGRFRYPRVRMSIIYSSHPSSNFYGISQ